MREGYLVRTGALKDQVGGHGESAVVSSVCHATPRDTQHPMKEGSGETPCPTRTHGSTEGPHTRSWTGEDTNIPSEATLCVFSPHYLKK